MIERKNNIYSQFNCKTKLEQIKTRGPKKLKGKKSKNQKNKS